MAMRRYTLIKACLALIGTGLAIVPAAANPAGIIVTVPKSHQIDFRSVTTGRDYRLMVAMPEAPPPPAGYPVVYVIDGGLYFATAVETMRLQARNFIKPAIIVGIGYPSDDTTSALTRRNRDLTLPLTASDLKAPVFRMGGLTDPAETGGLDAYLAMLLQEVRPMIGRLAPIDLSQQVLLGHSLGGLAVLRQFLRDPQSYSGYVSSSPSIWFKDRAVLADEADLPRRLAALASAPALLLTVGSTEDDAPKLPAGYPMGQDAANAESRKMGMVSNLVALGKRLADVPRLRVQTVVFDGEDHAGVVPAAISRGLRVMLRR